MPAHAKLKFFDAKKFIFSPFEMVEAAGVEPASTISLIVVVHKFSQFLSATDKIDGVKISLTILLR